jgi:hypothetical protein
VELLVMNETSSPQAFSLEITVWAEALRFFPR